MCVETWCIRYDKIEKTKCFASISREGLTRELLAKTLAIMTLCIPVMCYARGYFVG